jgi:hypothetical protein
MMVTWKLLRKSKPRWQLLRPPWTKVSLKLTEELNKWVKKMQICLISEHLQIYMDPFQIWAKWENKSNYKIWLKSWEWKYSKEKTNWLQKTLQTHLSKEQKKLESPNNKLQMLWQSENYQLVLLNHYLRKFQ